MNKMLPFLLAGLLVLTGCARGYILTLNNGERIKAKSKPRFDKGFYYFKDASGRAADPVFAGRVREIAPSSQSSGSQTSDFKFAPSK